MGKKPYRYTSMDARRSGHLRKLGYTVTQDESGIWLSNGIVSQWFESTSSAVKAVELGWPRYSAERTL